jgi:hypothetical protein
MVTQRIRTEQRKLWWLVALHDATMVLATVSFLSKNHMEPEVKVG